MADANFDIEVRAVWWLMPALALYLTWCLIRHREPDADAVTRLVKRATRWRPLGGKWRRC